MIKYRTLKAAPLTGTGSYIQQGWSRQGEGGGELSLGKVAGEITSFQHGLEKNRNSDI